MKHAHKVQIKQLAKAQFHLVTQLVVFGKVVISFVMMLFLVTLAWAGVVGLGGPVKKVKMRIIVLTTVGIGTLTILVMLPATQSFVVIVIAHIVAVCW